MKTPASIGKHPIHPMLVALPIGLWIFSFVCDLIALAKGTSRPWKEIAFYSIAGGIAGALLAALPGLIDLFSISAPRVKTIGITHMILNLVAVGVFGVDLWLRTSNGRAGVAVILSAVGICLIGVSGWLGAEMVYVHRVAVDSKPVPSEARIRRVA